MTKCELQDESRQRLAAPTNWRAGRMRAVRKVDVHSEQFFSAFKTCKNRCIHGFTFTDLRSPGDRKKFVSGFRVEPKEFARLRSQHYVTRLERNRSAAWTGAKYVI